jgi:hypothetical protein
MHPFWGPQTTRLLDVHKSILICIWYSIPPHFCNSIVKGQWHIDQTGKLVIMCNSWFVAWPSYPELFVDKLLNSRNKHTRLPTWLQRGLTRIPRGQATEASHKAPTMHRNKISLEAERTCLQKNTVWFHGSVIAVINTNPNSLHEKSQYKNVNVCLLWLSLLSMKQWHHPSVVVTHQLHGEDKRPIHGDRYL